MAYFVNIAEIQVTGDANCHYTTERVAGQCTCPCATRRTSIYKGLATLPYKCSRNCQRDESRSLGVGVQALASNPLQAAAIGNVVVVSVAERYVLLS